MPIKKTMGALTITNHSHLAGASLRTFETVFGRMRGLDDLAHALQIWGQPLALTRLFTHVAGWHTILASRPSDGFTLAVIVSCSGRLSRVDLRDSSPPIPEIEASFRRWHTDAGRPTGTRPGAGCRFGMTHPES